MSNARERAGLFIKTMYNLVEDEIGKEVSFRTVAKAAGLNSGEAKNAVDYAANAEWVSSTPTGKIRITNKGIDAALKGPEVPVLPPPIQHIAVNNKDGTVVVGNQNTTEIPPPRDPPAPKKKPKTRIERVTFWLKSVTALIVATTGVVAAVYAFRNEIWGRPSIMFLRDQLQRPDNPLLKDDLLWRVPPVPPGLERQYKASHGSLPKLLIQFDSIATGFTLQCPPTAKCDEVVRFNKDGERWTVGMLEGLPQGSYTMRFPMGKTGTPVFINGVSVLKPPPVGDGVMVIKVVEDGSFFVDLKPK